MKHINYDGVSPEAFENWLGHMLLRGLIEDIHGAAELLGTSKRSVNRMREVGGDRMLALAMTTLVDGGEPYQPVAVADLPRLPKYTARGRPHGSKDRAPRHLKNRTVHFSA